LVSFVIKTLIGIACAYAALVAFVWVIQDRLIYFPEAGREVASTPAARGVPYDDFTITTEDGEKLNVWWVPAATARGAVLLFHGNAGNISHRIEYALMFRALGYSTLLVDYRGYGKSSGKPSEEGTYRDADAAWRWLTQTRAIPEDRIVLFGESLGGGVASWLAARHQPRALVLASTFTSTVDLASQIYSFLPVKLISRYRYPTLERLRDVRSPVLVIHSPQDDVIPFSHGRRLYEGAREPKAFLELRGGHNDGFVFTRPEWVRALGVFLDRASQKP
jgi:fermentation-respiration switch protein FrsA (DUF1100 family)